MTSSQLEGLTVNEQHFQFYFRNYLVRFVFSFVFLISTNNISIYVEPFREALLELGPPLFALCVKEPNVVEFTKILFFIL